MKSHLMKVRSINFCALLFAALISHTITAAAQTSDPVALIQARDSSLTAGDLETAVSFYAEDATVRDANPEPGTTGIIAGKDQIRELLASRISANIRFESMNFQVNGDTVLFEHHVWFDDPDLIRLNLLPVETHNTVVIRDGKIHDWLINIKAEWLARADAAFAVDEVAKVGMPRTGGARFPVSAWLLAVSGGVGLCGLVFRLMVSARKER